MSQLQSGVPDTDVSRPSALPSANLQRIGAQGAQQSISAQNSAQYLDSIEEEWNKKVDAEIDILVDGMADLVNLASVSSCSAYPSRSNY
jgi:mediator of RNA polymerase II transcription subunit 22